jgi:ketosteroid isomerase-like protein
VRNLALLLALFCGVALADDRQEIREVMASNFAACNAEDVDALMETCSVDMPDRECFREESEALFGEKDIHYSMEDFLVTKLDGDYAEARVVQATYSDGEKPKDEGKKRYLNGTALLPATDCVEYMVAFKKDGRKWKCYMTISDPVPYRKKRQPAQ